MTSKIEKAGHRSTRPGLLAAAILAVTAPVTEIRAQTVDYREIQTECRSKELASLLNCVRYLSGFVEGMAISEHVAQREPLCVGKADRKNLVIDLADAVRAGPFVNDDWAGPYLANLLFEVLDCAYTK